MSIAYNHITVVSARKPMNYFYGVPARNPTFVQRSDIMSRIDNVFNQDHHSSECKVVILSGLGGMGKTQLATKYCYQCSNIYRFIFWIQADNLNTIISSFRKLAINLGLDREKIDNDEMVIQHVLSFAHECSKWLLVFDNVDNDMAEKNLD